MYIMYILLSIVFLSNKNSGGLLRLLAFDFKSPLLRGFGGRVPRLVSSKINFTRKIDFRTITSSTLNGLKFLKKNARI